MTRTTIITTTINVPEVLREYSELTPPDVKLDFIVAGDLKTPEDETRELLASLAHPGRYLAPNDVTRFGATDDAVGFNSIQRRNLALLEAIAQGSDVIITVDDDNHPIRPTSYVTNTVHNLSTPAKVLLWSPSGWWNPGRMLIPPTVHRGYPLSRRHKAPAERRKPAGDHRVMVNAGMWMGDPDIDAIERMVNAPDVYAVSYGDVTLAPGTWAPFNTQNTAVAWEAAPLLMCLPHVGRYDDIWASYIARSIMDERNWLVRYGHPYVKQVRNEHDLMRDLQAELYGMEHTDTLERQLRRMEPAPNIPLVDRLELAYLAAVPVLPDATVKACRAWIDDVERAIKIGEEARRERE